MPLINFRNVLSCSSEDRVRLLLPTNPFHAFRFSIQIHCSENLLKPEQYKKWLSSKGGEERITCILEFEKSSLISSIDIGNDGSAFIELFVSRSSSSKVDDWTVLLPGTLLMTPNESRSNTNRNQVKLLTSHDLNKTCLNEKWDRLKIVCEQKFNRLNPFGLCFIKLYSPSTLSDETNQSELANQSAMHVQDDDEDDETGQAQSKIGSFFAKKQAEKNVNISTPSASDQIRALSNVADELLSKKPMNDNEIQTLLNKDVKNTPNRLSKRRLSESTPNENEIKRNKTIDQSKLMKHVVFVLSGFQNPLRSELRNKAATMGAIYNDDWDGTCTHLICAFANTPKFTQVKEAGRGCIVNKQWILDCYKQKQFLSEKNYEFPESNKNDTSNRTSERRRRRINFDDEEENDEPIVSKDVTRKPSIKKKMTTFDDEDDDDDDDDEDEQPVNIKTKRQTNKKLTTSNDVYDAETDEDEPTTSGKPFELADFFHGIYFYVFDGDFDDETQHDIRRVIYAYDGRFEKQLTTDVKYVITNRLWNPDFDKALKSNSEIKFLTLDWLQDCHDENKLVPYQPYSITP